MINRILAVVLLGAIAISTARAHTPLASSAPAAGSSVAAPVKELVLEFGADVRLTAVTLTDSAGAKKALADVPTAVAAKFSARDPRRARARRLRRHVACRRRRFAHRFRRDPLQRHGRALVARAAGVSGHRSARPRTPRAELRRDLPGRRRRALPRAGSARASRPPRRSEYAVSRESPRSRRFASRCCITC